MRAGDGSVCLIGVGKLLAAAQFAAAALEGEGVSATVWDPRVVKPLDPELIADAARHRVVVCAEDGLRDGGVGAAVADQVMALACTGSGTCPRIGVLGVPSQFLAQGNADQILARLGLDGAGMLAEARRLLG